MGALVAVRGRPTLADQARVDLVALRADGRSLLEHAGPKARRLALGLQAIAEDPHASPVDRLLAQLAAGIVHDLARFEQHLDGPAPEPAAELEAVA